MSVLVPMEDLGFSGLEVESRDLRKLFENAFQQRDVPQRREHASHVVSKGLDRSLGEQGCQHAEQRVRRNNEEGAA